ncbi:DUF4179 domain-containing protein [Oscillibacter valericigenes]|nr:DUF4179 domain-containing protein [Oscillibacter valericigenes]
MVNEQLDLRLRNMAREERLPVPQVYEDRINRICGEIRSGTLPRSAQRRHRPRKVLLLAAAAAVLLSVSALAASGALSGILGYLHQRSGGLTLDQETVIQQDTALPGRCVADNGVTVTLEETYGDGNHFFFYLIMDLPEYVNPETMTFDTLDVEMDADGWEDFAGSSTSLHWLEEESQLGGPERFLLRIERDTYAPLSLPAEGTVPCTLRLENLVDSTSYGPNGAEILVPGNWSMAFALPCDGRSITMDLEGYTLVGNAALSGELPQTGELLTFTLRPLGARLWYVTEPVTGGLDLPFPTVILEDGSEVSLIPEGGAHIYDPSHLHAGENYLSYGAEAPILLDQVVSVRFGDLVIPWEPQEA